MPLPVLAAAAIPAAIGLVGQILASGDRARAEQMRASLMAEYDGLDLPNMEDIQRLIVEKPEILKFQDNPELKQAQLDALHGYRDTIANNGMDAQYRAGMDQALTEADQHERSNRMALESDMNQRGLGGSNMELLGMTTGSQAAANQAHQGALYQAAEGQKRKDAALSALAGYSSKVRDQDFGQAKAKSDSNDSINQFNSNLMYQGQMGTAGLEMNRLNGKATVGLNSALAKDKDADNTAAIASGVGSTIAMMPGFKKKKEDGEE